MPAFAKPKEGVFIISFLGEFNYFPAVIYQLPEQRNILHTGTREGSISLNVKTNGVLELACMLMP